MSRSSACEPALPAPDDPGPRWWRHCWRPRAGGCGLTAAPPARHAARPAAPAGKPGSPPGRDSGRERAARVPRWRITHPVISTARDFRRPGRRLLRHLVPALRVDHGAQLPVRAFRMGWYGRVLAPWCGPRQRRRAVTSRGEDRPAGLDGGGGLSAEPDLPTTGCRPVRTCSGWTPRRGSELVPIMLRSPSVAGRVVLVSAVSPTRPRRLGQVQPVRRARRQLATAAAGHLDRPLSYNDGAGPTSSLTSRWSPSPSGSGCRFATSPARPRPVPGRPGRRPGVDQRNRPTSTGRQPCGRP